MSGIETDNERIYKTNEKLDIFISHAVQAVDQFIADRSMLDRNWKAK